MIEIKKLQVELAKINSPGNFRALISLIYVIITISDKDIETQKYFNIFRLLGEVMRNIKISMKSGLRI